MDVNAKLGELKKALDKVEEEYTGLIRTKDLDTMISLQRDIATQLKSAAKIIAELKAAVTERPELKEIVDVDLITQAGLPILHPSEDRKPQDGYVIVKAVRDKVAAMLRVKV